jgi:hypothetical protein
MIAIGLLVLILGIAFGTGRYILERLGNQMHSSLECFVYSVALGLIVLISAVMLLGFPGYLYSWGIWGVLLVLGLLTYRRILELGIQFWRYPWYQRFLSCSLFEKMLLIFLGIYACVYLLIALSPPSYGDGIHYLFPTAQTYIRHHRIEFIPYLFTTRPKNMVMLYVVGYLLSGEILAQLFNYILTLLTGVLIYSTAKQYAVDTSHSSRARKYALLAVTIFYTMPLTKMIAGNALSEPGVLLYGFLAFHAFLVWWETTQVKWLVLAGVFSGFCAGFKVIGIAIPLVLGLLVLFRGWQARDFYHHRLQPLTTVCLSLVIFTLAVILIGAPWYYVTYVWTGDPLYAGENVDQFFIHNLSQHSHTASEKQSDTTTSHDGSSHQNESQGKSYLSMMYKRVSSLIFRFGPKKLAEYAWKMTMTRDHQAHIISPLYLAFIPLLLLFPSKNSKILLFVWFSLLYFVIGVNLWGDYNRYIIPIYPVLSIITARVIYNIQIEYKILGQMSKLLCILSFFAYFPTVVHAGINRVPVVLGLTDREVYLERSLPGSFTVIQHVNDHLPETSKVLLMGEYKLFLLEREYIVGGFLSLIMQYQHFEDPDIAYQRLKLLEVTHVILNQQKSNNSGYDDKEKYIENFKNKYLQPIYHDSDVYLYELK